MQVMGWNKNDLINLYNYTSSGHFFDKHTMRFFNSRVTSHFKRVNDHLAYFITTECGPAEGSKRMASIRKAELVTYVRESDGRECQKVKIDTVGEFNNMTLVRARAAMEKL